MSEGQGQRHTHPNYWAIWVYLLVLTVAELGVAFLPWSQGIQLLVLVGLAVWKALLVALFFMHLRWEGNRLRIFAIAPLPLTVIVIIAVMTEFVR